ncbi:hypothetical protein FJT64_008456 [Amphibalanus amphitrite]|uniref:Protein CIP2A n=1 Tax=Amphibalanus amphitrite TaxID=1232801 RepID=A0A6A4VBW9_AMPAM|nr:hypothetical protein FJT64_008456 [Amphibalanus amphitrite]
MCPISAMAATEQIRNFITAADTYRKTESSKSLTQLQRHIKILFVVSDLGVFSADAQLTCDFYLSLHRLLSSLGVTSQVTWLLVRLLEHLCTDTAALALLRDRYCFLPLVAGMLVSRMIIFTLLCARRYCFLPLVAGMLVSRPEGDRTTLLLSVTEALTADITLDRFEPFVGPLLRTLSELVCERGESAAAALRALYHLTRCTPAASDALLAAGQRKRLAKALLSTESGRLEQLQAAELLLAVTPAHQPLPGQQLRAFLDLVWAALADGLAGGDVKLMRQAGRLLESLVSELAAETYEDRLAPAVKQLVEQVTPERHHQAGLILRPLSALVRRGAGGADVWRPVCGLAARLMDQPEAVEAAAGLLEAALHRQLLPPDGGELAAALAGLERLLSAEPAPAADPDTNCRRARAVTALLAAMAAHTGCRAPLAERWRPELLVRLLRPLPPVPDGRPRHYTAAEVVVGALELARALANESAGWLEAQLELLRDARLLAWLGCALSADDRDLVQRALRLLCAGSLHEDSVQQLTDSLSCQRAGAAAAATAGDVAVAPPYRPPIELSQTTVERVDAVLARLQQERGDTKESVSLVDTMELYEFKVAALTETVAELEQALQAASTLTTSLRLQGAQSAAENAAVRRLLVAAERRVESLHSASRTAEARLATADAQLTRVRQERDQCQRETQQQHAAAQRLERELTARSESLRTAQQAVTETEARRAALAEQVAALTAEKQGKSAGEELSAARQRQEAALQEQESRLQETSRALHQQEQQAAALRTEVTNLELLCKSQERSLAEKDAECAELLEDNRALRKIQDMIHSISSKAGKEKK